MKRLALPCLLAALSGWGAMTPYPKEGLFPEHRRLALNPTFERALRLKDKSVAAGMKECPLRLPDEIGLPADWPTETNVVYVTDLYWYPYCDYRAVDPFAQFTIPAKLPKKPALPLTAWDQMPSDYITILCSSAAKDEPSPDFFLRRGFRVRLDGRDLPRPVEPVNGARKLLAIEPRPGNPRNSEGDFIRLKDGTLLFAWSRYYEAGRTENSSWDNGGADIVARRSADNGETWAEREETLVRNDAMNVMSVSFLRLKDGRIAFFYIRKLDAKSDEILLRFSSDEAKTWSDPVKVTSPLAPGWYVLNNSRVIQLASGRIVVPVAMHRMGKDGHEDAATLFCMLSDDAGATWRAGRRVDVREADGTRVDTQEPGVVELRDGRVMMWARTSFGAQYAGCSSDGGETWGAFSQSGLVGPRSPATVRRLKSGDLVAIWNDHRRHPELAPRGRRSPLSVAVSRDDGRTWSEGVPVECNFSDFLCYTALLERDDGLLIAYCSKKIRNLDGVRVTFVPRAVYENLPPAKVAVTLAPGIFDVVVAPDAVDSVRWAAEEATNFLSRVLGAPVPIVPAPERCRMAVVLGDNAWSRAAGLDPAAHPRDTYLIRTAGNRIFIAGADEKGDVYRRLRGGHGVQCFQRGTALGVYAFLERFAGCRFYFPGELGEVVPRREFVSIPPADIVSTPANLVRKCYLSDGALEPEMAVGAYNPKILNWLRLRLSTTDVPCCHGVRKFGFMSRFAKTHPEYFARRPDGTRCNVPTGSGNSKDGHLCYSNPEVRDIIFDECVKRFRSGAEFVDIMPNDGYPGCHCERCRPLLREDRGVYGRMTPVIWDYTADIARRLAAAGVKGKVTQMAYSSYSDVPDFELPKNVAVMVATRGPWALADGPTMAGDLGKVRDWGAKTGGSVWIWTYPHKYRETMIRGVPDVAPKAWANYYRAMKGLIFGTFAESESDRSVYHYLNYYVFSRVMWDFDADADAILDEHYRLMFGAAAAEMKEFYGILEEKWTRGVAGNVMDTDVGPVMSAPTERDLWTNVYSPEVRARLDRLLAKAAARVPAGSLEARRIAFFRRCYFDGLAEGAAEWRAKTDRAAACRWDPASGGKIALTWYAGDKTSKERVRTEVALRRDGGDYVFTFDCEEPHMDELAALDRGHDDPDAWRDSGVEFRICPNGDRMHYYHVIVNAKGCITDLKGYKPGRTRWVGWSDAKWESGATARVTPRADGWTTELRVPVSAIGATVGDVPIEFLRSRMLKTGKGSDYYKWCQVSPDLGNYEFYGTVRLP